MIDSAAEKHVPPLFDRRLDPRGSHNASLAVRVCELCRDVV